MTAPKRILIFQTAFLGDVILTLPMVQRLHAQYPDAAIDIVTTPSAATLLRTHPAIAEVIAFDKRGAQQGLRGMLALAIFLQARRYDIAIVPHRSFRTTIIMALSRIPVRIGFTTAAFSFLYHHRVKYRKDLHEAQRGLSLLEPLGISSPKKELPALYVSPSDVQMIDRFLFEREILEQTNLIAIAPGSVWNTKRWLPERFAQLALKLADDGFQVLLIGGKEDEELCRTILTQAGHSRIHSAAGALSLLQSAELIRRCRVIVTNDSAPLHLGVAMRTPVIAIFGATVPAFGFAPYGVQDEVVEVNGLPCRPCAIHGGNTCPIGTFDCMNGITSAAVFDRVLRVISDPRK